MRYFQKLADRVDVTPLLHAVTVGKHLWNQHVLRTTYPGTPHTEIDDIWLRWQVLREDQPEYVLTDLECVNYPALAELPQARLMALDLLRRVEGTRLGRIMITRLAPGGAIAKHADGGLYAEYYSRYHIALQCLPGAIFACGTESVQMQGGDAWWVDAQLEHEVRNGSADDRITMIVDIKR